MKFGQLLLGGNLSWRLGTVATSCLGVLAVALLWAWFNAGALRILPFGEGPEGAALALKFGQALDAVATGAQEHIQPDVTLQRASTAALPAISVPVGLPGINLSLQTVVGFFQAGWLSETRIQGTVISEVRDDAKHRDGPPKGHGASTTPDGAKTAAGSMTHRVWLQIDGPRMPTRVIRTEPAASLDDALTAAALAAYEILRPVVAAYYQYRRAPARSLQLVEALLHDPNVGTEDKAAAHRIWGLVLREAGDDDGARDRFQQAAQLTAHSALRARIRVDEGYIDLWQGAPRDAAKVFEMAVHDDPRWAVPLTLWGDALAQSRQFAPAAARYQQAIALDAAAAEPWLGRARLQAAQLDYAAAFDSYAKARMLSLDGLGRTTIALELGDVLLALGCVDSATLEYDRAMRDTPALAETRRDWQQALACRPADSDLARACPVTTG